MPTGERALMIFNSRPKSTQPAPTALLGIALRRTCWQQRGSTPCRWKHDRAASRLIALSAEFLSLAALHHSFGGTTRPVLICSREE